MQSIREEIDNIIKAAEIGRQEAAGEVKRTREVLARAEDAVLEASASGDTEAYIRAKATRDTAQEVLDMHRGRLARLTTDAPLIDAEQYNTLLFLINEKLTNEDKKDKQEVLALCDQIAAIVRRNRQTLNEGNALLQKLQGEVYKYADCPHNKQGEPVIYPGAIKQYKPGELSAWAGYAFENCAQYSALVASVTD